jgi:hypothetical protein
MSAWARLLGVPGASTILDDVAAIWPGQRRSRRRQVSQHPQADARAAALLDLIETVVARGQHSFLASVLVLEGKTLRHRAASASPLQGGGRRHRNRTGLGVLRHRRLLRSPDLRLRYFDRPALGALARHRKFGSGSGVEGVLVDADHVRRPSAGHFCHLPSGASGPDARGAEFDRRSRSIRCGDVWPYPIRQNPGHRRTNSHGLKFDYACMPLRRRARTFVPVFIAPPGPPIVFTASAVITSPHAEQVTCGWN